MNKFLTFAVGTLLASATLAQYATLKETLGKHFLIGAAIDARIPAGKDPQAEQLVKTHYNQVVAENCMKSEAIHPAIDQWHWTQSDQLVDWAQKNHMTLIGHCLVWHSQAPKWLFEDKAGKPCSREALIGRLYNHIMTVMTRYKGKIKGWDVVNEAILDDGSYRQSPFYTIIGPEYIELAFRFAHEADPDAELYYNDYSMANPAKREAVVRLVRSLKAKGIRIDAVGMQSHNGYNYPDYAEYEKTIETLAAEGVKVMLSEVDLNMLPSPEGFGGADISQSYELQAKYNPYTKGLDKKTLKLFNQRYLDLFKIIARHKAHISRVTFWCVDDNHSWLNDWPIKGRTNYPALFDRQGKAKPVVKDIVKLFE